MDCRSHSTSVSIITEVAATLGVDPTDLDPPLHDVVDPDAVDTLVGSCDAQDSNVRIQFTYCGCDVTISSDGSIDVRRSTPSTDAERIRQ